jgi:signal transduction histidine kinase
MLGHKVALMGVRDWFRPPRHVLAIFVAVGIVSAAALAWLMGSLLEADTTAEKQRQQERLEQTADRAVAAMQSALSDLELQIGMPLESIDRLPDDVVAVRVGPDGIVSQPGHGLLYYPKPIRGVEAPADFFETVEQVERSNPRAAAESYARLVQDYNNAVRAGALIRLARVRRRMHDPDAALRAYDELSKARDTFVAGLPAELLARVGRASVYQETHQASQLQMEAAALDRDLQLGKWQLTIDEYTHYLSLTREWLGAVETIDDPGRVALAGAAAWLWENRLAVTSRQLIDVNGNSFLIVPRATPDGFTAAIAGAGYLASLCNRAIHNAPVQCTLSDADRVIAGPGPRPGTSEVRIASETRLPWTIQLSPATEGALSVASPMRSVLWGVAAVLALVWIVSAAFIMRAISREIRVAQLQSDFIAAVSHEFRSPLSSLCQISEMLFSDRLNSEDRRRESYGVLARESSRLRRLVEGLLDFQRFEAGGPVYHFEPVELRSFTESVVGDFRERAAAIGYTIELTNGSDEHYVRADREALTRAIWNLLDNAVKYSPECKTVWVDVEHSGDQVTIAVRDRGLGIPRSEQHHIFEKFVRGADSKARRIKGTGIGLAMVRHIVKAHGGEIRLASQPGEGSRFSMILPVSAAS